MILHVLQVTTREWEKEKVDGNTPVIGLFMEAVRLDHTVSKICVNSLIQRPSLWYGQ